MNNGNNSQFQFSKLLTGSSQTVLIILVIIIGVGYIVNGTVPDGLIEFAKWVVGGTSAQGVAYMIKSGVENKAKIETDNRTTDEAGIDPADSIEHDFARFDEPEFYGQEMYDI